MFIIINYLILSKFIKDNRNLSTFRKIFIIKTSYFNILRKKFRMSDIKKIKEIAGQTTGMFVLFTMLTVGFFPLMWLWKNMDSLNNELGEEVVKKSFVLTMAILLGLSFAINNVILQLIVNAKTYQDLANAAAFSWVVFLLQLATSICEIILVFQIKKSFETYVMKNYKFVVNLNGFWTFLFNIFYIIYRMNSLESDIMKAKIISDIQKQNNNE